MKIILLSESLANRIAAGEVVERPASVVKELVENSLDAGAKEISVRLEGSGSALIRVSDDGEGISPEDLALALERHSTSKVKDEADLFRISTLGFRGEALPSIASVSKLEIVSRARGQEIGYRLEVEGGKKKEPAQAGCPFGTTVEVRDLFFNTPARRKFLKSPATELGHICDVVNRMALAFPDVHFRLYQGAGLLSDSVPTVRLEDRLRQILGPEIAGSMVSFAWNRGKVGISGLVSAAPNSFPNTRYLLTYVNRRFVRDRILTHALSQGYETLLMKGRYPAAVLYLDLPPEEVDVNVHPSKYEVRFRRQSEVHDAVVEAVREGLRREAKEPPPRVVVKNERAFVGVREEPFPYPTFPLARELPSDRPRPAEFDIRQEGVKNGFYSSLEVLGQVLGCYLVCVSTQGLVLIDQHAAHERVAFERMRHQLDRGQLERQSLLIPQTLELPLHEAALLEQNIAALDHLGFSVEGFGPNTYAIESVPALLPPGDYRDVLRRIVVELADVERSTELKQDLEERLMTLACHSVIRANRKLNKQEIEALLRDLDQIDFATQCPHGRPVLIQFGPEQLERMFKRA
ncbi:MAG: DNA mismatch repair endonuclease MutL [Candidatus Binatia bacterium]